MAGKRTGASTGTQAGLSRERVLRSAVAIADERGLAALTMRSLAESLGVEAMSLYHHVANKEAVLDGLVEVVMAEIEEAVAGLDAPEPEDDWRTAMRRRVLAARDVLLRHPWAPSVFETRTGTSLAVARYFDGVLALMRRGGFSYDLGHRALHALGSRALGFSQELFTPDGAGSPAASEAAVAAMAEQVPHLAAMIADASHDGAVLGWCDYQAEFEFGLDLILDGLERLRAAS
ncbi:TetR/AcrR family transcriptional regulator C-terminal domain-containing protein [Glycomyces sp. TRM65418]|uniref:TetR/AcrR family transcriptional regulator C-terminal domain-containing protein n=1 Tax=Glycomyces sp. TRM65418 TaxID=2867006 RepID=UPI001CE4D655|nr:TetR/AcrR family transcriptional regulator C-terminal domain-containing protein [Glycomyces sp. TRM65418]MCC3765326.1 TetR/AcrR family transcriptional regulator C-terminal domain-containing protein [Glycomyces sp. TRM65418]QZD54943.1 TetR/AcrR family transcriptional regulator C-terminal domain-containing protein [Glycomyces sp. TRM65418]